MSIGVAAYNREKFSGAPLLAILPAAARNAPLIAPWQDLPREALRELVCEFTTARPNTNRTRFAEKSAHIWSSLKWPFDATKQSP